MKSAFLLGVALSITPLSLHAEDLMLLMDMTGMKTVWSTAPEHMAVTPGWDGTDRPDFDLFQLQQKAVDYIRIQNKAQRDPTVYSFELRRAVSCFAKADAELKDKWVYVVHFSDYIKDRQLPFVVMLTDGTIIEPKTEPLPPPGPGSLFYRGKGLPPATPTIFRNNDNEEISPICLKYDDATLLYVESNGRTVSAIDIASGKTIWTKDPFSNWKLKPYRFSKPVITSIKPETKPGWIEVRYNSSQFGSIEVATGNGHFAGND